MKSAAVTFLVALMLSASVAHAKPNKSRPAAPTLRCSLTDFQYFDAPDLYSDDAGIAVKLKCHNRSKATARVKARDVFMINSEGDKYGADRDSSMLDSLYELDMNPPTFVDHFIEIAPGQTVELGFTFLGDDGLTDDHLTLDVDGVKYTHVRESSASDSADE